MEERHGFYPWRRYLARITDMGLYGFLWTVVSMMAFSIRRTPGSTLGFQILDFLVTVLLMLALEPVFLAVWGTTPGKRIFGITVRRKDGERLSYEQGLFRAWRVFSSGMGLIFLFIICSECTKIISSAGRGRSWTGMKNVW